MEDDNGGKICPIFPTLQHIASLNVVLPYWRQQVVVDKMKKASPYKVDEDDSDADYYYYDLDGNLIINGISDVIVKVIKSMEDLLEVLPKRVKMRLLDLTISIGCEIFEWGFSVFCDIARYSKNVRPAHFYHFLDCIIWNPLGSINHKETAKMLCQRCELSDSHKYIISCNYCLNDETNNLLTEEVISFISDEDSEVFLEVNPMVGLFTEEISDLLPVQNNDPLDEQVLSLLIYNPRPMSIHDAAIQYIWDNFNERQRSKYFSRIFNGSPSYTTIHYLLSQVKTEQINITCRLHGQEILSALIDNRFFEDTIFNSFEYILPHIDDEAFLCLLKQLFYLINGNEQPGLERFVSCCPYSRLFHRAVNILVYETKRKHIKQKDILKEYNNYHCQKYGSVFKLLWEKAPSQTKREILKPFDLSYSFMICLLSILSSDNISNISSILKYVSEDEKVDLMNRTNLYPKYTDFLFDGNSDLLDKFFSFLIPTEDDIYKLKIYWFNHEFDHVVIKCIKRNKKEHFVKDLNKFIKYFDMLSDDDINKHKLKFLQQVKILELLFEALFNCYIYKLEYDKLDYFFKWCCNIESNDELKSMKIKLFKNGSFEGSFVYLICSLFLSCSKQRLIDEIICWMVNNESKYIDAIKKDFYESDFAGIMILIIEFANRSNFEESIINFVDWCFPLANSDNEKLDWFSKEILRNNERVIYIIRDLISRERFEEVDLICKWYCNYFQLNIQVWKNEMFEEIKELFMSEKFHFHNYNRINKWFSQPSDTKQNFEDTGSTCVTL